MPKTDIFCNVNILQEEICKANLNDGGPLYTVLNMWRIQKSLTWRNIVTKLIPLKSRSNHMYKQNQYVL